jgi:uncharacterized protein (TIGR03067 family)
MEPENKTMKITTTILGLVCTITLLTVFGCSKAKQDSAVLQGTWQGQENGGASSIVLTGNNLEFHGADAKEWYKGTFTVRDDVSPKQMIIVITDCPFPQYVGKTANAIYTIENGTWTIAGNEPGNPAFPAGLHAKGVRTIAFKMK